MLNTIYTGTKSEHVAARAAPFYKDKEKDKLRANIASEHVTSTLDTGTTAATFSSFEKVSQLTVKEFILIWCSIKFIVLYVTNNWRSG